VLERADTEDDVRLGGELLTATVLFSDLRGFTSFAEGREPAEVIGVLNRYLTEMSDAILDHDGTLVAYMGDGIMAVFGAPIASTTTPTRRWARRARCSTGWSGSTSGSAPKGSATGSRWASASTRAT
jgi:class 3 adenylate cyclase